MFSKNKFAFSLIELSITILIIAILITGSIKAISMVKRFSIQSAQTMTMSSPVSSILDLELWLETTLEESFSVANLEDGQRITRWNNINPQHHNFPCLIAASASEYVVYRERSSINNLPAIYAQSDKRRLMLSHDCETYVATPIPSPSNQYTVFVVHQRDPLSIHAGNGQKEYLISNGLVGTNGWYVQFDSADTSVMEPTLTVKTSYGSSSEAVAADYFMLPGKTGQANRYYPSLISEVIIYSRRLPNKDIEAIKDYLIKKYHIKNIQ